jgi:hypothetical protein
VCVCVCTSEQESTKLRADLARLKTLLETAHRDMAKLV